MSMQGVTVGAYEVKSLLGSGGMGDVYLAEHTLLGRRAAIKFLQAALVSDADLVERFFTEAKATTAVADAGIVQIFDFGYHTDGSAYIVMEFLEGVPLDDRLAEGLFDETLALHIARHLANSLAAAHRAGVIHRDLKLENVFLVHDPAVVGGERPKILDFGLAKLSRAEPSRATTRTGVIMGTPIYMSPEQCKGAHDVDERSDLYSLGCLLFCMVTGRPPFDYGSAGELIAAHLREDPPVPSARQPGLSVELDQIMARCLAKDPAARFQSMDELARVITGLLGDGPSISRPGRTRFPTHEPTLVRAPTEFARPTTLSSAATSTSVAMPARRSRRSLAAIVGLLVAAAAGAGLMRMTASSDASNPDVMVPEAAAQPIAAPQPQPIVAPEPQPQPIVVPMPVVTAPITPAPIVTPEGVAPKLVAPKLVARPGKRGHKPMKQTVVVVRPAPGSADERSAANMDRGD